MNKKTKANIDDGCNPVLVAKSDFDLPLGIPIIKPPKKIIIPDGITPFSMINDCPIENEALGFYEMDFNFSDVLRNPQLYIESFSKYTALISPDCSLYRDAPLAVQLTNIYRNRAIGSYFQINGQYVIPQIRWGNEYTYTTKYFPQKIAFLGVEKTGIVAISTYGCFRTKEDKYYFSAGLESMMEELEPKVVLVYGSMPDNIFLQYYQYALFKQYPDWITRKHM